MKLDSSFAGTPLKDYKTAVLLRSTMNYAASVDDANPLYFEDDAGKAVIAPPMFAVALTWPIAERIWEYINNDRFPKEIIQTQVHYTEHLIFYRPVCPGDTLTIKGRIAAIMPHRAGTVTVIRFDAVDAAGTPVFTEYIGGMMRGVECIGGEKGQNGIPALPAPVKDASPQWESRIEIERMRPFIYDGCANIHFPIHTSVGFAHMVGLPDIILQGTATLAYAARELVNREAGGDSRKIRQLACRFTGMVIPPGPINIRLIGKQKHQEGMDVFFEVTGNAGERVLSKGYALIGNEPS